METKRCSGYKGVWECEGEYPDHNKVPVSEFHPDATAKDGLQARCKKCKQREHRFSNPKTNAISKIAYSIAGSDREFYKLDKADRKIIRAMATERYEKEKPNLTLVRNNPPKPAAQPMRKRVGGTMEGEVVPQGWVYMIGNPEIPHLLKIGRTYPDGIDSRLSEAQRWGRAELVGKFWFDDANEAEKRIHAMLYKWNLRTMGYIDCGKELFHVSTSMVEKVVEEYTKELESSENAVG